MGFWASSTLPPTLDQILSSTWSLELTTSVLARASSWRGSVIALQSAWTCPAHYRLASRLPRPGANLIWWCKEEPLEKLELGAVKCHGGRTWGVGVWEYSQGGYLDTEQGGRLNSRRFPSLSPCLFSAKVFTLGIIWRFYLTQATEFGSGRNTV